MSNTFKVRNYIRAKSEKGLRSLMLEFDIVYAKGYWFAWYYEIAKDQTVVEIESDGTTENNRR
jgi:hypothetical protein